MVKNLEGENYAFSIFTGNTDLDKTALPVPTNEWQQYSNNTRVWYNAGNSIVSIVQQEIEREKPSALFIIGIYNWQYNFLPLYKLKDVKKIISVRGMLHPDALKQKTVKKKVYLSLWKLLQLRKGITFHATDETEKNYVQIIFGKNADVKVAENFPQLFLAKPMPLKEPGKLKLFTIALISPMKNYLQVLKALKKITALVEYTIYGQIKDAAYWQQCIAEIENMPANITINYAGAIYPSEVEISIEQHHCCILPSKSENYGHSIIEALASGRPVITSHNTPWNNLQQQYAGFNINPENINEIAAAINVFAAMNAEELNKWSAGAATYTKEKINITKIKQQYSNLFSSAQD